MWCNKMFSWQVNELLLELRTKKKKEKKLTKLSIRIMCVNKSVILFSFC